MRQVSPTCKHTPFTLLLLCGTKKGSASCLQQFVLFISAPLSVSYLHLYNFFSGKCLDRFGQWGGRKVPVD